MRAVIFSSPTATANRGRFLVSLDLRAAGSVGNCGIYFTYSSTPPFPASPIAGDGLGCGCKDHGDLQDEQRPLGQGSGVVVASLRSLA